MGNPGEGEKAGVWNAVSSNETVLAEDCGEHLAFLRRFLRSRGVDPDDVPDLIQDTFVLFWTKRNHIEPDKSRGFLIGVARNILLAHRRKHIGREATHGLHRDTIIRNLHPGPALPGDSLHREERTEQVRALLAQLPPRMASVVEMAHINGHTVAEVAAELGISAKTVRNTAANALTRIRGLLRSPRQGEQTTRCLSDIQPDRVPGKSRR